MKSKYLFEKSPLILAVFAGLYLSGAISVPVLTKLGYLEAAHYIDYIYSYFCHQLPERSFYIGDFKIALCIRDLFLYFGILISSLTFWFVHKSKQIKFKGVKLSTQFILMTPMLFDLLIQKLFELTNTKSPFALKYIANNDKRIVTGLLFGIGFGWLILNQIRISKLSEYNVKNEEF